MSGPRARTGPHDPARVLPLLLGPVLLALLPSVPVPPVPVPPAPGPSAPAASVRAWASPGVPDGGKAGVPGWRAPLDGPLVLLRAFDPPDVAWGPGHRGVDLAASPGTEVRAAGPGTVLLAGDLAGRGVVVVEHDGGLRTTYEPVDSVVGIGRVVVAGELLGRVGPGSVHCGRPPTCLHWGLRRGRDYLDPWRLLDRGRPVLLPTGPP